MALRFRIVSEHSTRLGQQATKVFGVHGGTIGRGTDNEWILPDPERYLSGKHARVDFRAGKYVLVDTSSNGTYVNGAQVPLGKYHDYLLKDGDDVRLGEYELLVTIEKSNDFPPDDSAIVAYDGQAPSASARKSIANDIGADLDLSALLESAESSRSDAALPPGEGAAPPSDAYGQAFGERDAPGAGATPWHMMTRPLKVDAGKAPTGSAPDPFVSPSAAAATPAVRPGSGSFDGDVENGLASFCRGANIDPRSLSNEARGAALQLAGQLLRESVLGLMELNQSRNEFRNRFRMTTPQADAPESPLNFSRGVDEALVRLLNNLSQRAGSVETVRHNFREHKAQNTAALTAMRAAFEEFLSRVDPKELEERFERTPKRGMFGTQNKNRNWELYQEMYVGLAQRPPDGFPHLFVETFARSYEAKMRTLVPRPRQALERIDDAGPENQAVGDT
jgi:type VI secretion system FHA domain protein